MEKRADGIIELEAGDEVLVVTAKHRDGSTAIVGSFTGYRLAHVGARAYSDEYGRNGDGARGPVLSTDVFSTCLDQHGVCPQVSSPAVSAPPPKADRFAHVNESTEPHPGPYTRELLEEGPLPDFSLLVGPSRAVDPGPVVWDLFEMVGARIGDVDEASAMIGLDVIRQEPERDAESHDLQGDPRFDDIDAALAYVRAGGALCKVPDYRGSKHFRFLVVPFPGSPLRGNCV